MKGRVRRDPGEAVGRRAFCFLLLPRDDGQVAGPSPVASRLADRGDCQVHVLDCTDVGPFGRTAPEPTNDDRLTAHSLGELVADDLTGLPRYGGDEPALVLGESILEAFLSLQAEHGFELVHFPGCAAAMRLIEAKRHGAFAIAPLVAVELGEPAFWLASHRLKPPSGARDLKLDHCERYAFAHADVRIAGDAAVLAAARALEWPIGEVLTEEPDADRLLAFARPPTGRSRSSRPAASLTVLVSHYNHGPFLPGALTSLAAQSRPPDEVIVIDDGSTSSEARRVFAEQEEIYPGWTFLRQANAGPGRVRNVGLERARGAFFLPFDSDNLAAPDLVERLLGAMESDSAPAALACHNLSFVDDSDVEAGRFVGRYSPTGGPRLLAAVENVYGDSCSIFDTEALRAVGGFEVDRWSATEDWETFVKLACEGYEIDVLPLPLFYYRTNSGGRLQGAAADPSTEGRLHGHLVERFFLDASLSRLERRQLWETLQAYDRFAAVEIQNLLAEQRRWHDGEMAALHRFREEELDLQEARLLVEVETERARAHALAAELDALRGAGLRRWARERLSRGADGAGPAPRGR